MNRFIKQIGLTVLLACASPVMAKLDPVDVLVRWNLDGLSREGSAATSAAPVVVHDGIESSDFSFSEALKPTAWHDALTVYAKELHSTLAEAVAAKHYFSFTLTPKKGKKINYSSILNRVTINAGNLGTGASIQFVLMSSVTDDAALDSFTMKHRANNEKATTRMNTFDVSKVKALQKVKSAVEFRVYAVLVSGVGNRMGYGHIFYKDFQDDLRVMGTVE